MKALRLARTPVGEGSRLPVWRMRPCRLAEPGSWISTWTERVAVVGSCATNRADAPGGFVPPAPNLSPRQPDGERSGGGSRVPTRVGVRRRARQVVRGGQARLSLAVTQLGERFPPLLLLLSSSSIPVV